MQIHVHIPESNVPDSVTKSLFCPQSAMICLSCDGCEVVAELVSALYTHVKF